MASNQGESDGEMPRVTASIPGNKKTALDYMAQDRSNPGDRTYVSELVRESVTEYLSSHWDELPEEAKDLLDDDLEANAGGDGD